MAEIEAFAFNAMPAADLRSLAELLIHGVQEGAFRGVERHAVLWPLWSGDRWHDIAHVELQGVREHRIRGIGGAPHALGFGIGLDQRDARGITAGGGQIVDRSLVDREEAAGRAIFRRHIGDGRTVRHRHVVEPWAVELDELADHTALAQHLRHRQHEIGCRDALLEPAGELETDDLRQQHRNLLAEHDRLGLDAADAPSEDGQAVDHRGVRIRADQRIGIGQFIPAIFGRAGPDRLSQEFEIDLMADTGPGRDHPEIRKCALPPFQEAISLAVALVFEFDVLGQRLTIAESIDDDGVIDDEIHRHQRIDLLWITAEGFHGVPHRGEIDDGRNAGEILHQHPGRPEGDFLLGRALVPGPLRRILDVSLARAAAVFVAQHVLDDDLERERQPARRWEGHFFPRREANSRRRSLHRRQVSGGRRSC